jgi:hypothetical protein
MRLTPDGGTLGRSNARLDATSGLADTFNPSTNNSVRALAVQPDGKIVVGGAFNGANGIGGQARNFIARVDGTTGLAESFNPNANGDVHSIAVQPDGKILVGGLFNGANSIGGQPRNRIARLNPTTGAADSFDPNALDTVESIVVQLGGKVLVGGSFTAFPRMAAQGLYATISPDSKRMAGSSGHLISMSSARMLSPPPCSLTAKF